jgi:hypothetical protein
MAGDHRSQETVSPVGILTEVSGIPARVPYSMLREEHSIRVLRPTWACSPQVSRPEAFRETTLSSGPAYVFNEATHDPSVILVEHSA